MRQEIQGLRAVAVLLVVLFHLWPRQVPGGYVGVDIFFVISGFLITSLLLREVGRSGTVSLREFWARRLRRLLPASYLVLFVSAVGVVLLEPRLVWPQFFREILAAGLYVENWVLAVDSVNYLAAENTPSPAQHYWTLSAEEQFYLLWPLLILLGIWIAARWARARRTAVFGVLATAVVASLAYSLWITAHDPSWAYFVTSARAWEFGAGALLAFVPVSRASPAVRSVVGWAGLLALALSAFVLDEHTPMPGTAAIVIVVAAAVVIWVGDPQLRWAHSRLLTLRPATWLGDISYSVYLWHWPLIILLPSLLGHGLRPIDRVSILLATLGLAALTKTWVEDPVRRARRFGLARPRTTFLYAGTAAALLAVLCVVPRQSAVRSDEQSVAVAKRIAKEKPHCFGAQSMDPRAGHCPNPELEHVIVPAADAAAKDTPPYGDCYHRAYRDPLVPCRFGKPTPGTPHIAVIGDSHARILMTVVEPLVQQGKLTADMFVMGGCPWSTNDTNLDSATGRACSHWRSNLFPLLDRTATDYDAVLTTARLTTMHGSHDARVEGLAEAWKRVTDKGVPVAVVRDNPQNRDPTDNPNLCLSGLAEDEPADECAMSRSANLDRWFDALTLAQERTPGSTLVDLSDYLCHDETCPVVIGGVDVYADSNHLTVTFARTLAPYLYRALVDEGLVKAPRSQKS